MLVGLLLVMEWYGTLVQALPAWTATLSTSRMLERTALMHASWLSPRWLLFLLPVFAFLLYQSLKQTGLTAPRDVS